MKCARCQKRVKSEERKELVSELVRQPTTALNYTIYMCPKCGYREYVKEVYR
jgi:DNA-directed RNA polymerase subunit RPC12/RpoP